MTPYRRLIEALAAEGAACLVRVAATAGSAPREAGAAMVVRPSGGFHGTIGGGALEWRALGEAQRFIARGRGTRDRRIYALGPELSQCCGGRVDVEFEVFGVEDVAELEAQAATATDESYPVLLFGAGHVGRALALALAPLPFALRWIDSRSDAFPTHVPANVTISRNPDPLTEFAGAPDGAFVVVMTHSHPLDLALVDAALAAQRFAYVGLIGSATKRARFESLMRAAGRTDSQIEKLICPIGISGVSGKAPSVIATAVAAQLLVRVESRPSKIA